MWWRQCPAPLPVWLSLRNRAYAAMCACHSANRASHFPANSNSRKTALLRSARWDCQTNARLQDALLLEPFHRQRSPPPAAPDGSSVLPVAALFHSCVEKASGPSFATVQTSAQNPLLYTVSITRSMALESRFQLSFSFSSRALP